MITLHFHHHPDIKVYALDRDHAPSSQTLKQTLHADELAEGRLRFATSRRDEYLRTRYLFHKVVGLPSPLVNLPTGSPNWPEPWKGSITHKSGHVAIALTQAATIRSVGLDLERIDKLHQGIEQRICNDDEQNLLSKSMTDSLLDRRTMQAIAFSFKESIFKAINPLGGIYFGFKDAEITTIDTNARSISARLLIATSPYTPAGFIISGEWLETTFADKPFIMSLCQLQWPHSTQLTNLARED